MPKEKDDFEAEFDRLMAEEDDPNPEAEGGEADDEAKKTKDEPAKSTKDDEGEPEDEAEGKKTKEVDYETLLQQHRTLQGQFKPMLTELETLKSEIKTLRETKGAGVKPKDEDTDAIDEDLKEYLEQYDYIANHEAKLRTKELAKLRQEILDLVKGDIDREVRPSLNTVNEMAAKEHFKAIYDAHSDFQQYKDSGAIKEWIASLPSFKKKAYEEVYANGNTEDVIQLITDFKEAKGITAEPSTDDTATGEKPQTKKTKKSDELSGLEVVGVKSKPVSTATKKDNQDFGSAFEEFAGK